MFITYKPKAGAGGVGAAFMNKGSPLMSTVWGAHVTQQSGAM